MTQILLISDTERVKQIFESLEKNGSLQLRTAATLIQADQEIATSAPEFTFVQSRISGFSGEILFRHLSKILPAGAKIFLLAGNADEMKQAQKHAEACIDLTLDDEALAVALMDILHGASSPRESGSAPGSPGSRSHHSKTAAVTSDPLGTEVNKELLKGPVLLEPIGLEPIVEAKPAAEAELPVEAELPAKFGLPAEEAPLAKVKPSAKGKQPAKVKLPVEGKLPAEVKQPTEVELSSFLSQAVDGSTAKSFAEIMQRASNGDPSGQDPFGIDDRVTLGKPGQSERTSHGETAKPVSAHDFSHGEPLADAMRRANKKERPLWVFVLAVVLVSVPVLSYLAGKKTAPPESALAPRASTAARHPNLPAPAPVATTKAPGQAGPSIVASQTVPAGKPSAVPAVKPSAVPAVKPAAVPAVKPAPTSVSSPATVKPPAAAATPAANPTAKLPPEAAGKTTAKPAATVPVAKPEAKSAVKAGIKSLPPILSYAKLDTAYGKTHPGWQRYLGSVLEYKLFKEAEVYRAMQVLARKHEPIPAPLFKRILQEFGGTDSYRLEPAGEKGKYLVEKGETKNGVAITLYRNKADHRMKAFVLYYH